MGLPWDGHGTSWQLMTLSCRPHGTSYNVVVAHGLSIALYRTSRQSHGIRMAVLIEES